MSIVEPVIDAVDSILEWLGVTLKQTTESYCAVETAYDKQTLAARDGSLLSVIKFDGARYLVGPEEFEQLQERINTSFASSLKHVGHAIQAVFTYDRDAVKRDIQHNFAPARETAKRLHLNLDDLFRERVSHLSSYCAQEHIFFVLWTRPNQLSKQQLNQANKRRMKRIRRAKMPSTKDAQCLHAGIRELQEAHQSFVRSVINDFSSLNLAVECLDVHAAVHYMRLSVDPDFTNETWRPVLPGDQVAPREVKRQDKDISSVMWPNLARQIIPRDGQNIDLRTARVGDRIYAPISIELFPKEIRTFLELFQRTLPTHIPWRMSFMIEGGAINTVSLRAQIAAVISFASAENVLLSDADNLLRSINTRTDEAIVKLRVDLVTWVRPGEESLLRIRVAELAKAVQGWGNCEVAELSGDPYGATIGSAVGVTTDSLASASVAPLSDVIPMLPVTRPASPWKHGALLLRSPDGKPWPFQPGSSQQTTWIDLIYARPGSGKSVLSNAINLALCLMPGLQRLPRIAIVDIGPSSSGLISLLVEALPKEQRHYVAYYRMKMTPEFAINPFDTQLGCRFPTPLDRSFLVNFITLLATPLGQERPYDGIGDMAGMIVNELYKQLSDEENPNRYAPEICEAVDNYLQEINFQADAHTTWWEVVDALFEHGNIHMATLAQRYAMPLLSDAISICRSKVFQDLYQQVTAPTGETLIEAFGRMISSAVREFPILAHITSFDLGEARIVSLDLDEVAKTGGEAADRQTAVMYMLARYVLARHYYLTPDHLNEMPKLYHSYHRERITEIREDPKRLVMDEFHRTSKAQAVRNQVVVDMREGRKWKVQVALLSQSVDDFDSVMVDFATAIYIMDAGPAQAQDRSAEIFGLSDTARLALRTRVHGPRAGGGTFLAQFATKAGMNTQLLTNTLGPIELWAFSTTAEDTQVRERLYRKIGPVAARRLLAKHYPSGSLAQDVEKRIAALREGGMLGAESSSGILDELVDELLSDYKRSRKKR